jgi:hypothetical protein
LEPEKSGSILGKDRPREHKQHLTHPHANKNNSLRVQENNLHIGKRQQEIGKRGTPTKEEKDTRIYIIILAQKKPSVALAR